MIYDDRACQLGEGPLWHPTRKQFFWFDILNNLLLSRQGDEPLQWRFDERVSAAAWVNRSALLIASESGLYRFDLDSAEKTLVAALPPGRVNTRSNDGRADPFGGFWIGTMGKNAETGAGAIYRYYKGELRMLFPGISIPNGTCFAPDLRTAYFADSATAKLMRVALDGSGWPKGAPEVFVDLTGTGADPDGAVTDAEGRLWLAQWNGSQMACYAPDGTQLRVVPVDAPLVTCPAFGGEDFSRLFCTSAYESMTAPQRATHPNAGKTFAFDGLAKGMPEPQVIL